MSLCGFDAEDGGKKTEPEKPTARKKRAKIKNRTYNIKYRKYNINTAYPISDKRYPKPNIISKPNTNKHISARPEHETYH